MQDDAATAAPPSLMVTDEMIDRAWSVLREEINPPYMAQVGYYVSEDSAGLQRERELAELKEADEKAHQMNRDLVRRALEAALSSPPPEGGIPRRDTEGGAGDG